MPTVNLNKKEFENSKFYKYIRQEDINMIPSDPLGSLDESLFRVLTNFYRRVF